MEPSSSEDGDFPARTHLSLLLKASMEPSSSEDGDLLSAAVSAVAVQRFNGAVLI